MIFLQLAAPETHERQNDEGAVSGEHYDRPEIMEPLPERQTADAGRAESADEQAAHDHDAPFALTHPGAAFAERIRNIRRDEHAAEREHGDREQPLVPGHDESNELVEPELRPLIQTAFQRQAAIEINDDRALRDVEEHNREEPEK